MITQRESQICLRRVQKELNDLVRNPIPNVKICPDPTDILNWFLVIDSLTEEEYIEGEYILNIKLSQRYPFEAPDFRMLTPSGRFDVNKKLCFSNSSYHQEAWSPIWTMRTIVLGFLSFFLEKSSRGVGHIETSSEVKKELAVASKEFNRKKHPNIMSLFGTT